MGWNLADAMAKREAELKARETSPHAGSYDQHGAMVLESGGLRPTSHPDYVAPTDDSSRVEATPDRGGYAFSKPEPKDAKGDSGGGPGPYQPTNYGGTIDYQVRDYQTRHMDRYEEMIANAPQHQRSTDAELAQRAGEHASLQIDPLVGALERSHEEQQAVLESQRGQADAAHAGYEADVDYALSQAEKQAIDRAVARGGGRAGLSDYIVAELQAPIIGESQRIAAQHAQDIKDIAQQEVLLEKHFHDKMYELTERRGLIESEKREEIRRYDDAMVRQDWQMAAEAQSTLVQLEQQANQFDQTMALEQAKFQEQISQFEHQMDRSVYEFDQQMALKEFQAQAPYYMGTYGERSALIQFYSQQWGLPEGETSEIVDEWLGGDE